MTPLRVALIGAGSMAANHARVVASSATAMLAVVIDRDARRAEQLAHRWGADSTTALDRAFGCDAAVIATSTPAHAQAALALIDAGVPVLVEKPLTSSLADTRGVIAASHDRGVALMCGFVERFNSPYRQLIMRAGGRPSNIGTVRIGPTPVQAHSSVVDDVLLHDLDLVLRLTQGDDVCEMSAHALAWCVRNDWPDAVTCTLTFASGTTAGLHASRVSAIQERAITIVEQDGTHHRADLLEMPGDPLAAQFDRFVWLVRDGSAAEQDAERASILPSHELAHRIQEHLADAVSVT